MSFPNQTGLNIGASGTLAGRRYTVAGRVVVSMEEEGQTYYWNEFHLVDGDGQSATLVHEVGEQAAQWKLFTSVEAVGCWTASEAAARRAGDVVELDGARAQVTLVDESRVDSIEGQAPEGVEQGDVAKYFNATAGNRMYVVSWTSDEVEIFRGMNLPSHAVVAAFQLRPPLGQFDLGATGSTGKVRTLAKWFAALVVLGLVFMLALGIFDSVRTRSRGNTPGPVKPQTPPAPLTPGVVGQVGGKIWRITGRTLAEIRKPRSLYERHEYHLAAGDGATALLVYGLDSGNSDWYLFQPVVLDVPLAPAQAAMKKTGNLIGVSGEQAKNHGTVRINGALAGRSSRRGVRAGHDYVSLPSEHSRWRSDGEMERRRNHFLQRTANPGE